MLTTRNIIILSILVVIVLLVIYSTSKYNNYLIGYWKGESGYLEEADLSVLELYISPKNSGYLIMITTDGTVIYDGTVKIKSIRMALFSSLFNVFKTKNDMCYDNYIEFADELPEGTKKLSFNISILNGTLCLYDKKSIYAFLIKNNESTLVSNAVYNMK